MHKNNLEKKSLTSKIAFMFLDAYLVFCLGNSENENSRVWNLHYYWYIFFQ